METPVTNKKRLNSYSDCKQNLYGMASIMFDSPDSNTWENDWFYQNATSCEDLRMCTVISLAVYEIEQNNITKEMIGEVDYYYYQIFVKHSFNNVFKDKEAQAECFADVKWCYNQLIAKGLLTEE